MEGRLADAQAVASMWSGSQMPCVVETPLAGMKLPELKSGQKRLVNLAHHFDQDHCRTPSKPCHALAAVRRQSMAIAYFRSSGQACSVPSELTVSIHPNTSS